MKNTTSDLTLHSLEEYILNAEPTLVERSGAWRTAIGLQDVDGLKPSEYLMETARKHIEGEITMEEASQLIESYYRSEAVRNDGEANRTEEADKVSVRIAQVLSEKSFSLSVVEYKTIHRRLFDGIYKFAGKLRDYNITKNEWVLDGDTVTYGGAYELQGALEHDIEAERNFSYENISLEEAVRHLCRFVSNLWQIHAFGEGNTRTTAVFVIKYLRTFGFSISNTPFEKHSKYFRNALVRANYNNLTKEITATSVFLERFFNNILLGEKNELKNRTMHIRYKAEMEVQSANDNISKCQNGTLTCTLDEAAILVFLSENPTATQKDIAAHIGKSERTVKRLTVSMAEKGLLAREGGRQKGIWKTKTRVKLNN